MQHKSSSFIYFTDLAPTPCQCSWWLQQLVEASSAWDCRQQTLIRQCEILKSKSSRSKSEQHIHAQKITCHTYAAASYTSWSYKLWVYILVEWSQGKNAFPWSFRLFTISPGSSPDTDTAYTPGINALFSATLQNSSLWGSSRRSSHQNFGWCTH